MGLDLGWAWRRMAHEAQCPGYFRHAGLYPKLVSVVVFARCILLGREPSTFIHPDLTDAELSPANRLAVSSSSSLPPVRRSRRRRWQRPSRRPRCSRRWAPHPSATPSSPPPLAPTASSLPTLHPLGVPSSPPPPKSLLTSPALARLRITVSAAQISRSLGFCYADWICWSVGLLIGD
jgi:hypothetical protein